MAIVIKVVMIIRQESNKSEFNNCISTEEREIDGEFLGLVGLSLKNEAYQYFVAELFWLQVLICITIRLLLNKKKFYVEMCQLPAWLRNEIEMKPRKVYIPYLFRPMERP